MNFKKMGRNLLRGILAIIFVWWLWRWVQGQGGILAAFNRAFPGMSTATDWSFGISRQPRPTDEDPYQPTPTPDWRYGIPVIRRHTLPPITSDVEDAIPPEVRPHPYQPTPTPVAPLPVAPGDQMSPFGLNDRLPWENNRRRGDVINALKADITRIGRYPREVANTFTEVARAGGVDNYLSMQRERLTRARTLPAFDGPIGAVASPFGLDDRLPWENNRVRRKVIIALKADIARIGRYSREVANTFTEVARVGGVDNYLSMQRERLKRASTQPVYVGPGGGYISIPIIQGGLAYNQE